MCEGCRRCCDECCNLNFGSPCQCDCKCDQKGNSCDERCNLNNGNPCQCDKKGDSCDYSMNSKKWNNENPDEQMIKNIRDRYEKIVAEVRSQGNIDICFLGIGDNGHICSSWPESQSLLSDRMVEAVEVECPLSRRRITVTLKFLNESVKKLYFVIPPKNGKPQSIVEPHKSIRDKMTVGYDVILPEK